MEREKVILPKFDVQQYLKEGQMVYAKRAELEKIADKISVEGYSNIFLLGIGGTRAEFAPVTYIMEKTQI